jgi:hypothetical protein
MSERSHLKWKSLKKMDSRLICDKNGPTFYLVVNLEGRTSLQKALVVRDPWGPKKEHTHSPLRYILGNHLETTYDYWAWACGDVERAPVCHLGDPGSNLNPAKFLQWLMALSRLTHYSILCTVSKLGGETPSWIRVKSLIRNKKKCSLWEYCHATVES